MDNNIYTQVGIVLILALCGKNAILIVEFARELRNHGRSILEGRSRGIAITIPPDSDDIVCIHFGYLTVGSRNWCRCCKPPLIGNGRFRWYDRRHGFGRVLCAEFSMS